MDDKNEVVDSNPEETPEVASADIDTTESANSDTFILENLESMIRENLARVDKLNEEAKKHKEMLDSVLLNDETYQNHEEAVKQAQKVKNTTKAEIMKRPDVNQVALKLKELKDEVKELKESMNSYLQEYQRLSGSSEIEDDKGVTMQIIYVAKLVRRKA